MFSLTSSNFRKCVLFVIKFIFLTSSTDLPVARNNKDLTLTVQDILHTTKDLKLTIQDTVPTRQDTLLSLETELHDSSTNSEISDQIYVEVKIGIVMWVEIIDLHVEEFIMSATGYMLTNDIMAKEMSKIWDTACFICSNPRLYGQQCHAAVYNSKI